MLAVDRCAARDVARPVELAVWLRVSERPDVDVFDFDLAQRVTERGLGEPPASRERQLVDVDQPLDASGGSSPTSSSSERPL